MARIKLPFQIVVHFSTLKHIFIQKVFSMLFNTFLNYAQTDFKDNRKISKIMS